MDTVLNSLREIIGTADFYITNGSYSGSWDYGAMVEYMSAVLILAVVVASVFRFLGKLVSR